MGTEGNKTFLRITNKDIWNKLESIECSNTTEHSAILIHQKETNGKVKLNRWISTTAISFTLVCLGFLINNKLTN